MVVPVADHAGEQIGPAQERRVGGRRAAEDEVVAAAGAGVTAVEHELLARQPRLARRVVEVRRLLDELAPAGRGVDVDLDHPRVGRHAQDDQARVLGRLVAFQRDRQAHGVRRLLDRSDERKVVLERRRRRHEDVEAAVARLGADRGADHLAADSFSFGGSPSRFAFVLRRDGVFEVVRAARRFVLW